MIWIVLIAGLASCPIAFSGLWTHRWFRICVYVTLLIVIGAILQRR